MVSEFGVSEVAVQQLGLSTGLLDIDVCVRLMPRRPSQSIKAAARIGFRLVSCGGPRNAEQSSACIWGRKKACKRA